MQKYTVNYRIYSCQSGRTWIDADNPNDAENRVLDALYEDAQMQAMCRPDEPQVVRVLVDDVTSK
jgi:hypothetical protein